MVTFFAIALDLGPIEISVIAIAGLAFLVMFGLSSAKGGYQDLVKTTLENDKNMRNQKKTS